MGHRCRICGKTLPNERFSGKGHKNHICKRCANRPKTDKNDKKQKNISNDRQIEEIANFLLQSSISERNIKRLEEFASHANNQEIAEIANIVLEIAKVHPRKKKRLLHLQKERKDIIEKLAELNFMFWAEND